MEKGWIGANREHQWVHLGTDKKVIEFYWVSLFVQGITNMGGGAVRGRGILIGLDKLQQ